MKDIVEVRNKVNKLLRMYEKSGAITEVPKGDEMYIELCAIQDSLNSIISEGTETLSKLHTKIPDLPVRGC